MSKTFREIVNNHNGKVTDKWSLYLEEYERYFYPIHDKKINLFEIGIQNGGSLEIYAQFFTNAKNIVGCDIDEECKKLEFDDSRISIIIGDANTNVCEDKILRFASKIDVIIDDGSHFSGDIIRSFARYFRHLENDGIYIVEDLHCSYWANFDGGLNHPYSSISFFKRLADIINYEHWRNDEPRESILVNFFKEYEITISESDLSKIHSVEFVNSLCVIRKASSNYNLLGRRVVPPGLDDKVKNNLEEINGSSIFDYIAVLNDDRNLDVFNLIAQLNENEKNVKNLLFQRTSQDQVIMQLEIQVENREQVIKKLEFQVVEKDQKVHTLYHQLEEWDLEIKKLKLTNDLLKFDLEGQRKKC